MELWRCTNILFIAYVKCAERVLQILYGKEQLRL